MKISVIIPAYNVENYIAEAIDSVIEQTYENWEMIIVDDGSTDQTGQIIDEYALKDNRIIVFHTRNSGASNARNYALEKVTGDIIAFLDADDALEPKAFDIVSEHFRTNDIEAVYIGHLRMDEESRVLEKRLGPERTIIDCDEAIKRTLLNGKSSYLGVLWNKYFKREVIFKNDTFIRFSPQYKIGEDQVWLLEVFRNIKRVYCENTLLYRYRVRRGSLVHTIYFNDAKRSELEARKRMVELTKDYYPKLVYYAAKKYRTCINGMVKPMIIERDYSSLKYISSYGKMYFKDVMKGNVSFRSKIKELIYQFIYTILG